LYAPTWEGGTPAAAYSSLSEYGPAIVRGILADQRFSLIYRPHPLTGTRLTHYAEADTQLRELVRAAARQAPHAGHRVSAQGPVEPDLAAADLLIADISSLAIDYLVLDRPLTVTIPPQPAAVVAPTPLLQAVPRLGREALSNVAEFLGELVETDGPTGPTGTTTTGGAAAARRRAITEYYLSDTQPGAATRAFVDACGRMIALATTNWEQVRRAMRDGVRAPGTQGGGQP
jgi:hypothetical protein